MPVRRVPGILLALLYSAGALGHSASTDNGQAALAALLSAVLLAALWLTYLRGSLQVSPGKRRGMVFHGGTALCYLAVLGPLDEWADTSAAAHMAQHMLFMVAIAPLWVLARPLPQLAAGGGKLMLLLGRPAMKLAAHPMAMAWLHGAAIWFWHVPFFYVLALQNPWWHTVEHLCFLATAGLFWWAVLRSSQRRTPWALLAVLLTLVHTGFLGALLTFAQTPLYGEGRGLQDQQLAGLLMWVVGAIPYLMAAAWVGHRWFRRLVI